MNGNDEEQRSTSPLQRRGVSASLSTLPVNGRPGNRYDYNRNGIHDYNGSDQSDDNSPIGQHRFHNEHSTISNLGNIQPIKLPMNWNTSVSNWVEQASKGLFSFNIIESL